MEFINKIKQSKNTMFILECSVSIMFLIATYYGYCVVLPTMLTK